MVLLQTLKALALVPSCRHFFFFYSLLSLSASFSFCTQGKHFRKATGNQFSEAFYFLFSLFQLASLLYIGPLWLFEKRRKANRGFILWKEQPGIPRCWIYRHSHFLCLTEDAHSSLHEEIEQNEAVERTGSALKAVWLPDYTMNQCIHNMLCIILNE